MPVLFCESKAPNFRPFKIMGDLKADRSGGWMVGQLGLESFYRDFQEGRNRWSHSNCGFDLAQYKGTYVTLYPAQSDYIFWFDTDYGNFNEFKTLVSHIHPAILLNAPHTTVVLSKETTGRYRPKRVWIPPPTVYGNKWSTMSDWNDRGLAIFAITLIDFKFPWIHPGLTFDETRPYDCYDYARNTGNTKVVVKNQNAKWELSKMWWNCKEGSSAKKADVWYAQWPGWSSENAPLTEAVYDAIAFGPFVKKQQFAEAQIVLTYRSKWWWGGDILTMPEPVCNPKTGEPKSLKGREPCDPGACITKADIDKDGFINPEKWRKLTAEPTETGGFNAALRAARISETEEESTLQNEETSEDDSESSTRSRIPRGRLDGGRIRDLLRLKYQLKELQRLQNKRWSM